MALGDLLSFPLPQTPPLMPGQEVQQPPPGAMVLPSAPTPDPATAVAPLEQNKGLWRGFLSRMEDPNFRAALLQTGIGLMRSPEYGKSGWDVAADALGSGAGTLERLRERDKAQAMAAADKAQAQKNKDVELGNEGRRTGAYESQVSNTAKQAEAALGETIRSNKAAEAIRKQQADADTTRARAYSSAGGAGGRTPQDIQKINMLAAEYQAQGLDEVTARAKAVRFVETAATAKTPSQQILDLVKDDIASYNANPANWRTPLTPEAQAKMMDQAIERVMKLQKLDAQLRGEPGETPAGGKIERPGAGAPAAPAAPAPSSEPPLGSTPASSTGAPPGYSTQTPLGPQQPLGAGGFPPPQDPQILAKVQALRARNVPPEAIVAALKQQGLDPRSYGY